MAIPNDPRVARYCIEQHNELVEDLKITLGPGNFSTIADLQPFHSYIADIGVQKGGNMLGVERTPRNRLFWVAGVTLRGPDREAQFPRVWQQVAAMNKRIDAFAKSLDDGEEFVYLAYARAMQDPIGSYGMDNIQHMRRVADKYDSCGFFQKRVPGGFKLSRVS